MNSSLASLIHDLDARDMKNKGQYKRTISISQRIQLKIKKLKDDRINYNQCKVYALQNICICHSILITTR